MDKYTMRRIVREEIAMVLVAIVREADQAYAISDHDDPPTMHRQVRNVINDVADDMVRALASGS